MRPERLRDYNHSTVRSAVADAGCGLDHELSLLCECDRPDCDAVISVRVADHALRTGTRWLIVAPEHHGRMSGVVATHDSHWVVEPSGAENALPDLERCGDRRVQGLLEGATSLSVLTNPGSIAGSLLARIPDPATVIGPDGRVVFSNAACSLHLGRAPETVLGRHFREFLCDREHPGIEARLQSVLDRGETVRITRFRRATGSPGPMTHARLEALPVTDSAGHVLGAYLVFHDVSEIMRFHERSRLLASTSARLIDNARDGDAVLSALTDALIPDLADGVALFEACDGGRHRLRHVGHRDPQIADQFGTTPAFQYVDGRSLGGIGAALRTGIAQVAVDASLVPIEELFGYLAESTPLVRHTDVRSAIVVPVTTDDDGREVSVLAVWTDAGSGRSLDQHDAELVDAVGELAATALASVGVAERDRRATERRLRLLEAMHALLEAPSLTRLVEDAAQILMGDLVARVAVIVQRPDGLVVRSLDGLDVDQTVQTIVATSSGVPDAWPRMMQTGSELDWRFAPVQRAGRTIGLVAAATPLDDDTELLDSTLARIAVTLGRAVDVPGGSRDEFARPRPLDPSADRQDTP